MDLDTITVRELTRYELADIASAQKAIDALQGRIDRIRSSALSRPLTDEEREGLIEKVTELVYDDAMNDAQGYVQEGTEEFVQSMDDTTLLDAWHMYYKG